MPGYHNKFRAAPAPTQQLSRSPSLAQTLGPLALKYGINAAVPTGGLGADVGMALGQRALGLALGGPAMNPAQNPSRAIGDALAAQGGAMRLNHGGMVDPTEAVTHTPNEATHRHNHT